MVAKTTKSGVSKKKRALATKDRARLADLDEQLRLIESVIPAIASSFGSRAEVVLHDLRRPEASIVAISGSLTGRHVGGSMSQLGLAIVAAGDDAEPQYNYVTRAPSGLVLKSTTVPLRDPSGRVFGALCINVNVTELRMLADVLTEWSGGHEQVTPQPVTFADDVTEVIAQVIREEERAAGRVLGVFDKANRLEILRRLDRRGTFALQRSVPQVAEHLSVSRATIYTYLRELRDEEADADKA